MMSRTVFLLVFCLTFAVHSDAVYVKKRLHYSGLDYNRVTTLFEENNHATYVYNYNEGEHLSIGCEHDASQNITFEFYNSTSNIKTTINESRFETQGTRNLDMSDLYCFCEDTHGRIYSTFLNLKTLKAVVKIIGPGLILDDDTIPYMKKYSYKFKEPMMIEPTCTVSGMSGDFEARLMGDDGAAVTQVFGGAISSWYSASHAFWLTPSSRTISCTAKDLRTNLTRFTSTIDLKYDPDPTTAPSISTNSSANVEIDGPPGLILDDNTTSYNRNYSYKFKEPVYIELICTFSGVIGDYELLLEDDRGIGLRQIFTYSWAFPLHSVSRLFWLTPESRTIGCTARDLNSNSTRFTTSVDLKYEPDSTTAPSISTSTFSSHPQNQSVDERNPLDDDISHPQNQSANDMCSEASVDQVSGEGSRLCTEKLLVKALMRSALADEKQAEAEMRTALAAEAVQQGVAQEVGLLRDLVTILGRPPPALTIDRGHQV